MIVQICVGSSCYLKGSEKLVELFQKAIQENKLDDEITLTGRFCSNKCNRVGVTITIDDDIFKYKKQKNNSQIIYTSNNANILLSFMTDHVHSRKYFS